MMVRMLVTRLGMLYEYSIWCYDAPGETESDKDTSPGFRSTRVADSPSPPTQPTAAAGVMTKSAPKASNLLVRTCAASRFLVNTMEETYELSVIRKIY